jgi:hypothetical protein
MSALLGFGQFPARLPLRVIHAFFAPAPISGLGMRDNASDATNPDAHYGYVPQEAVAILFLSLYGISTS